MLVAVCVPMGLCATVITGRFPRSIARLVIAHARHEFRLQAYLLCLTDVRPALWDLDQAAGGSGDERLPAAPQAWAQHEGMAGVAAMGCGGGPM